MTLLRKTSIISYSREALEKVHRDIETVCGKRGLNSTCKQYPGSF